MWKNMKRSFVCSCRKVFELAYLVCGDFFGKHFAAITEVTPLTLYLHFICVQGISQDTESSGSPSVATRLRVKELTGSVSKSWKFGDFYKHESHQSWHFGTAPNCRTQTKQHPATRIVAWQIVTHIQLLAQKIWLVWKRWDTLQGTRLSYPL